MTVLIRQEKASDIAAIRELNDLAFGGEEEGLLVERLRADGLVIVSLVAVDAVDGHILFSELAINTAGSVIRAASLAPMAVRPGR